MTTAFSTYGFKSGIPSGYAGTDTRVKRSLPDREGWDVINVQEWGADPTGVADSAPAIQAAIIYAYANPTGTVFDRGARVFIPPGTYKCNTYITLFNSSYAVGNSSIQIWGAGRDATILKGSVPSAGIITNLSSISGLCFLPLTMKDFTCWNQSTAAGSAGINIEFLLHISAFSNLHVKGLNGFLIGQESYNMIVRNCIAECISATPSSFSISSGSIGLQCKTGTYISNVVTGFGRGIEISGGSMLIAGNRVDNCTTGIYCGVPGVGGGITAACQIAANNITNSQVGIYGNQMQGMLVVGNLVDNSSTYGISIKEANSCIFGSNVMENSGTASFDNTNLGTNNGLNDVRNYCRSMQGPDGFTIRSSGLDQSSYNSIAWDFVNCGVAGASPPVDYLNPANLYWYGGTNAEFNITNSRTMNFSDPVGIHLTTNADSSIGSTVLHFASVPTTMNTSLSAYNPTYIPGTSGVVGFSSVDITISAGLGTAIPSGTDMFFCAIGGGVSLKARYDGVNTWTRSG